LPFVSHNCGTVLLFSKKAMTSFYSLLTKSSLLFLLLGGKDVHGQL
jgi:hypothetical protein